MNKIAPPEDTGQTVPSPQRPDIPVVDVQELLGESREIILMHLGEAYRLRITARERLILTK